MQEISNQHHSPRGNDILITTWQRAHLRYASLLGKWNGIFLENYVSPSLVQVNTPEHNCYSIQQWTMWQNHTLDLFHAPKKCMKCWRNGSARIYCFYAGFFFFKINGVYLLVHQEVSQFKKHNIGHDHHETPSFLTNFVAWIIIILLLLSSFFLNWSSDSYD